MHSFKFHGQILLAIILINVGCSNKFINGKANYSYNTYAQETLDSIYLKYGIENSHLLRENYPFKSDHKVTYLASEEQSNTPNQYSYLWPYSGTLSATNVLLEATDEIRYKELLDSKILPGLEEYYDTKREPYAYASYVNSAPVSDRFYDDNVWLGIDFTDIYMITKQTAYLDKAKLIWKFILSGMDDKLGGGIYWCEQKKESNIPGSHAPGSVFALKLFEATGDSSYFYKGKELYDWTKKNLQNTSDYLYFDNIRLDGKIGRAKFAYNSGQMMQSAALLYKLTKDTIYLIEAQNIAHSCYNYFFTDFTGKDNESFRVLKRGDVWFTAVMLRGFVELYNIDKNKIYIDCFNKNMEYAWKHSRDENGLFNTDFSGKEIDKRKWLLTQAAMVEMYARLATIR